MYFIPLALVSIIVVFFIAPYLQKIIDKILAPAYRMQKKMVDDEVLSIIDHKVDMLIQFYEAYDSLDHPTNHENAIKVYRKYTVKQWIDDYHTKGIKYTKEELMAEAKKEISKL